MGRLFAVFVAFAVIWSAGVASAQVTSFDAETTPGTLGDGTAVVANLLSIDFDGQYTGSQLLVELTAGAIVQVDGPSGLTNDVAPLTRVALDHPDLLLDTYLTQGSRFADGQNAAGPPAFGGGAVNLNFSEPTAEWNDAVKISQSWNPGSLTLLFANILDRTDFVVANLSFTPDAQGSFAYFASAGGEFFYTREGNAMGGADQYHIANGRVVPVPEPAAAVLLLGAAAGAARPRGGPDR